MQRYLPIFVLILSMFLVSSCFPCKFGKFSIGKKIALVEVKGVIFEPDDVVEDLEKARKNKDIRAVVVRVDSPGGSVGASQEIFRTIKNLDKKKPVVVSMGDIAASGGYYVSAGSRKIFANEGTITGSIGVRMEHVNAKGFFDLIRIEPETLKSGKYKDIGSAYRALSPEERKILNDFLAELHDQFKAAVASSRNLEPDFVDQIAQGQIYSGLKAKEMGLVDEMGGIIDATKEAAVLANIKGDPSVVKMRKEKPWWYDFVTERFGAILGQIDGRFAGHKYFLYEWRP